MNHSQRRCYHISPMQGFKAAEYWYMMHRYDKGFKMPRGKRCSQAASNVMGGRYANSLWVPKGTKPLSSHSLYAQLIGRVDRSALAKIGEQIAVKLHGAVKLNPNPVRLGYRTEDSCGVDKPIGAMYCGKTKVGNILNLDLTVRAKDEPNNSQAPDKDD